MRIMSSILLVLFMIAQCYCQFSYIDFQFGTSTSNEGSGGIAVDENSTTYLAAYSLNALYGQTPVGSEDIFIIKYDSSGAYQSVSKIGSPQTDKPLAITYQSSSQSLFVCGITFGVLVNSSTAATAHPSGFLFRMTTSGLSLVWIKQLFQDSGKSLEFLNVALDPNDPSVGYVVGSSTGNVSGQVGSNGNHADGLLAQFNTANGVFNWVRLVGTNSSSYDEQVADVAIDSTGNVYIVGNIATATDALNALMAKYNKTGSQIWLKSFGGSLDDFGMSAVISGSTFYVFGHIKALLSSSGLVIQNTATEQLWMAGVSIVDGTVLWGNTVDCADGDLEAVAMEQGADSNIYFVATAAGCTQYQSTSISATQTIIFGYYNSSGLMEYSDVKVPSSSSKYTEASGITVLNTPDQVYFSGRSSANYAPSASPSSMDIITTKAVWASPSTSPSVYTPSVTPSTSSSPTSSSTPLLVTPSVTPSTSSSVASSSPTPLVTPSVTSSTSSSLSPQPVAPSVTPSTSSSTNSDPPATKTSKDSTPIIVGVVVGAAAVGVIGLVAGLLVKRRKSKQHNEDSPAPENPESGQSAPVVTTDIPLKTLTSNPSERFLESSHWDIDYPSLSIGSELGRGAFGVVYRAKWRNTECVVKQLDIQRTDDASVKAFLKEANNVRAVRNHPNICTMLGICIDPEHPICIVMEYVPLGSLWNLITSSKISMNADMVLDFAKDIASGMGHLHKENVLHCDLASRNLLVSYKGENKYLIKISDFGLSRRIFESDSYIASASLFPIRWTAPEALTQHKLSRASDVWSFGVTLWEIAEARVPYFDKSNNEVVEAVCNQHFKLPPPSMVVLPGVLYELMLNCWADIPNERPSFEEISQILDKLNPGEDLYSNANRDEPAKQEVYGNSSD